MGRRWALLAVLLLLPAAAGQTEILSDAEGDAQATAAGTAPAAGVETAHVDMLGLDVEETTEAFRFHMRVVGLDQENPTFLDSATIQADFQHRDRPYRVEYLRSTLDGTPRYDARLLAFDSGRGAYVHVDRVPLEVDVEGGAMTAEVPRQWLLDGNGTAPSIGRSLAYFKAFAQTRSEVYIGGAFRPVTVTDAMPDDGFGDVDYAVQHGLSQTGTARLYSDNPVRASNGEKATFVFYAHAANLAPDEQRFDLATSDVPEGWDVTLPASQVRIEGNFSRRLPVLVAVPFQHEHGSFEHFTLQMTSQGDAGSVGRLQIGIRYLATPQPAGHHDQLYLHARSDNQGGSFQGPSAVAYMNTLEQDERAEDLDVPPREAGSVCCPSRYTWRIYLEPGLQMGLDFDRNRTGTFSAQFDAQANNAQWELSGRLLHLEGDPGPDGSLRGVHETVLADLTPTSPKSIGTGTAFESVIQPTQESDLVPYSKHAAMALDLTLASEGPGGPSTEETTPMLTGGQFTLPLNEYRDPIEGVFNELAGLQLVHDGPAQRKVNPGDTVLFNMTLRNVGALDDVFSLRVNGTNADWARILGDQRVFVASGAQRPVVVALQPPEDAPSDDIVDLIVTAASESDEATQGQIRVVGIVDDLVDHPDESHLVQDVDRDLTKKETSAIGPIMLLAALAYVGYRRR